MKKAVFPGSFDPFTEGHLQLVKRATTLFDEVVILLAVSPEKAGLFSVAERKALIQKATESISSQVSISSWEGLTVDFCGENSISFILRGLRGSGDFEYESDIAVTNQKLKSHIETVFLMTAPEYRHISSSAVREIGTHGGDLYGFVPETIIEDVKGKFDAFK